MTRLAVLIVVAAAFYLGSAFYVRHQMIALAEQGCATGEAAGGDGQRCRCFVAILDEEVPLLTLWIEVTGPDLGTGIVERAEARARQSCPSE